MMLCNGSSFLQPMRSVLSEIGFNDNEDGRKSDPSTLALEIEDIKQFSFFPT